MPTYHVIPHTHWDREWYLSFDAFRVRLVHMLDDLLDILSERDDYASFLLDGQTVLLDDYLEVRPEREKEIAGLVRSDRLSTGPWYVLPDTFLVSGEALVRNLMRGRARAKQLGKSTEVGYIPDSFGHTAQIPQILRGFNMDSAVVWRGFGGEPGQEGSEYRWRSPDGSEVLMEHLSDIGYSGAYFDSPHHDHVEKRFEEICRRIDPRARTPERLVLSGGDHHWPVSYMPDAISHLTETQEGDVIQSSLARFFGALKESGAAFPIVEGELRFGYRWAFNVTGGVYSSRIYLKQANTAGQRLLERYLEPMNAVAVAAGARSQRALIDHGWKYLLQNHPHDSICGCSIDPVHREMTTRFEKLTELGRGVESVAWMSLLNDQDREAGDDRTLAFFNPSPFPRNEVVECEVCFFRRHVVVGLNSERSSDEEQPAVGGFALVDHDGDEVPFEIVSRKDDFDIAYTRYGYPSQTRVEKFSLRVPLLDLPPLGVRELRVERRPHFASHRGRGEALSVSEGALENAHLRVDVRGDGSFVVTDKHTGTAFGPLGYFEDGADAGDEYSYSPPEQDRVLVSRDSATVTVMPVGGRYRKGLRMEAKWSLPARLHVDLARRSDTEVELTLSSTAWLTAAARHVEFETTIDNLAEDHRLRVLFETGRRTNRHHADNAFAVLSRDQEAFDPSEFSIEVPASVAPMHRFVIVEDDEAGAAVLADGLPEYELKHDSEGVIALTLLRCVGQLSRGKLTMRPGGRAGWYNETPEAQCRGPHSFRYAFIPLATGYQAELPLVNEAAESFLLPIRWHAGKGTDPLRKARPALRIEPQTLVLSAFKESEDGGSFIVRAYNPGGETVDGGLHFGHRVAELQRADLEEGPAEVLARNVDTFKDSWGPYRIHTYRYRIAAET